MDCEMGNYVRKKFKLCFETNGVGYIDRGSEKKSPVEYMEEEY